MFQADVDYFRELRDTGQGEGTAADIAQDRRDADEAIRAAESEIEELNALAARMDGLSAADVQVTQAGATYRVDLAPAEDEYLLWDQPFDKQSPKVRAALREAWSEIGDRPSGA